MSDKGDRYAIAYQEALRAIADQQTALDALQTRAGTVASAGALATGLIALGRPSDALRLGGLLAIGCLLGIVLLTGLILWPRREWRFHFRASNLHWEYIEGPNPGNADVMKRDLALHLEAYLTANSHRIDRFGILLSVSIVLLFADIAAIIFEIWRS